MENGSFAVLGIGNAIVDIIAHAEDAFIQAEGLTKGIMTLIDEAQADKLYASMGPGIESSGGSAANTIAGIASLGGKVTYIGKVRNDVLGKVFRHDLTSLGVTFRTMPALDGPSTARCLILVSSDAQRTMNTFLGACGGLTVDDVDPYLVRDSQITYLEGYLYDRPDAKAAFHRAAEIAHAAGRKVALSLSDPFCVDRFRDEFRALVESHVDIVFANEAEVTSLFQGSFSESMGQLRSLCSVAAVTRGAAGCIVADKDQMIEVAAAHANQVVDTTGAGDLFASGFLHAYTAGQSLGDCGKLAGICAAEIISHFGARPETPLKDYVAKDQAAHAG